jgi:hypothetical protein
VLKVGPPLSERKYPQRASNRPRYNKKIVLEALKAANGFRAAAAVRLGCSVVTVDNYIKRFPEIRQEIENIRDSYVDLAESSLLEQVKEKNTQATIFLLKCLGKKRGWIDNPAVQLHAHVEAGSGNWIDIMKRVMANDPNAAEPRVIDITPAKAQLTDGSENG